MASSSPMFTDLCKRTATSMPLACKGSNLYLFQLKDITLQRCRAGKSPNHLTQKVQIPFKPSLGPTSNRALVLLELNHEAAKPFIQWNKEAFDHMCKTFPELSSDEILQKQSPHTKLEITPDHVRLRVNVRPHSVHAVVQTHADDKYIALRGFDDYPTFRDVRIEAKRINVWVKHDADSSEFFQSWGQTIELSFILFYRQQTFNDLSPATQKKTVESFFEDVEESEQQQEQQKSTAEILPSKSSNVSRKRPRCVQ